MCVCVCVSLLSPLCYVLPSSHSIPSHPFILSHQPMHTSPASCHLTSIPFFCFCFVFEHHHTTTTHSMFHTITCHTTHTHTHIYTHIDSTSHIHLILIHSCTHYTLHYTIPFIIFFKIYIKNGTLITSAFIDALKCERPLLSSFVREAWRVSTP